MVISLYCGILTNGGSFMKKMNLAVLAALTLVLLGGLTACDIPDYQLEFYMLDAPTLSGSTASTDIYVENIGWKDLKNTQVRVSVFNDVGTRYDTWTDGIDLSVGESHTFNDVTVSYSGTFETMQITAAGWDNEEDPWKGREVIEY
jgi:hypothetical protein